MTKEKIWVPLGYQLGTVIGITQPPPTEGAWNALFKNLSKYGLDNYYVVKFQAPSVGGGSVIPITLLYSLILVVCWI